MDFKSPESLQSIRHTTLVALIPQAVIKWSERPEKNCPGLDDFMGEFYKTDKEVIIPNLVKLFQKWSIPKSFYQGTITVKTKQTKTL